MIDDSEVRSGDPRRRPATAGRVSRAVFLAAAAAGGIALAAIGLRQLEAHPEVPLDIFFAVVAVALLHAFLYGAILRLFGSRRTVAAIFFAASTLLLLAAAGPRRAAAVAVLLVAAAVLALIGKRIARAVVPAGVLSTGVGLGTGIAAASIVATLLATAGEFRPMFLLPITALTALWGISGARRVTRARHGGADSVPGEWNWRVAAEWEIAFLIMATLLAKGLSPESGFDAVSRYLPYVKILARFHALPDVPWQFPFVLPQAGLAYAATLGWAPVAQRGAFLLALAAAALLVIRRSRAPLDISLVVALIVVSCPLIEGSARGLQPDAFGWVAVLLLGVVSTEGEPAGSVRFGLALGAFAGLCWCAKYSTIGFAAPLVLYALHRSRAAAGWRGLCRTLAGSVAGTVFAAGPWLLHTWRTSGNPVFPFLPSIFPSPLWRGHIDTVWGGGFAFEKGWRVLLFPIDMTIHTRRYIESAPGSFGLILLVFPLLVAFSLRSLDRSEKVWLAAAVVGTAAMWTRTPYLRYWLPAFWLAAPAAAAGARRVAEGRVGRNLAVGAFIAIASIQAGLGAFHSRSAFDGRSWKIFFGRLSEAEAIAEMPGAAALARLQAVDGSWPRVWYTGISAVGHADVIPILGTPWELAFHVRLENAAELFRYIDSVGCRYWVVSNSLKHPAETASLGIPRRYWKPGDVVLHDRFVTIYSLPRSPR